jgi:hypothetical protein
LLLCDLSIFHFVLNHWKNLFLIILIFASKRSAFCLFNVQLLKLNFILDLGQKNLGLLSSILTDRWFFRQVYQWLYNLLIGLVFVEKLFVAFEDQFVVLNLKVLLLFALQSFSDAFRLLQFPLNFWFHLFVL